MSASGPVAQTVITGARNAAGINNPIPQRQSSIVRPDTTYEKQYEQDRITRRDRARRQDTVLVRKKLPWLDGSPYAQRKALPGAFDQSKESLEDTTQHHGIRESGNTEGSATKRASIAPIGRDPALRAIGSTPSLRKRTKSTASKTLSLNSSPRPRVKSVWSKGEAEVALDSSNKSAQAPAYASSEYSSLSISDQDVMTAPLRKRTYASYQGLVGQPDPVDASYARRWLPSEVDLPLDEPSPRHVDHNTGARLDRQVSPRQRANSPDRDAEVATRLRDMPKAKTMTRRSIGAPAFETASAPPPPARRSTLFAMPEHLMPSSSSSGQEPETRCFARPVQAPPPPPVPPKSTARGQLRKSRSLNRAVTGLENLMVEALDVARDATESGRNNEVASILENATVALRKASTVNERAGRGRMSQPLRLSPPASGRETENDSDEHFSDASSTQSNGHSVQTAPTLLTRSAQSSQHPILVDQYKLEGHAPTSRKASIEYGGGRKRAFSVDRESLSHTSPRLYQPPSADSIVKDFAYAQARTLKAEQTRQLSRSYGAASDYYHDAGQSVGAQPGVRPSVSAPMIIEDQPTSAPQASSGPSTRPGIDLVPPKSHGHLRQLEPVATETTLPRINDRSFVNQPTLNEPPRRRTEPRRPRPHHMSDLFEAAYYHQHPKGQDRGIQEPTEVQRTNSLVTDARYDTQTEKRESPSEQRYSGPPTLLQRDISLKHPRRKHISLREGQGFSLGRYHRRQPIAREWSNFRRRLTACIACLNTMFIGLIAGIYAGEVPGLQYQLADLTHKVILGNVVLFSCLGATTLIFWPLPLLHGRKPYTLLAFALMLPLMFPQALAVSGYRNPDNPIYRCGLLIPRAFMGIAMGFANINFLPTLFDLFGASLMSEAPHQELVVYDDVRRQGGGVGVWLGIWSFCFVGSMSVGFCIGACIISTLNPSWGFYMVVILLAFFLLVNVIAPETRRAPYRRSIAQFFDGDEQLKRRVARGEVKLHISNDGPKWWWQEVTAGMTLTRRMIFQAGFFSLMVYLAWMYAQVTLVILFLGALLSRDYDWQSQYVGLAVLSVAVGAFFAVPLSKANLFSRARDKPQRTDSMTMKHNTRIHWSSHMLRRCIFTLTLPFAAIAYTLSSPGPQVSWVVPTIFCGLVGFLSNLAIAECVGLIMENFDTCDLQPGVNQKHRLQSMAETTRKRRTNYSSFPRICAGFFASQSLGFFLSAAATGVSGDITRAVGAQTATAIVAAILLGLTVLFIIILWRWKQVQVIPNSAFGSKGQQGSIAWGAVAEDPEWKPVIIGNPSGKMRRMNLLELGSLSRWTEIRRLNKLERE